MSLLNKEAYELKGDGLIYDYYGLIDGKTLTVSLDGTTAGVLKRGQLIDFDASTGTYKKHVSGGVANCIVEHDIEFATGEKEIVVSVYTGGNFRTSKVISDSEITVTDKENLRSKNIILK